MYVYVYRFDSIDPIQSNSSTHIRIRIIYTHCLIISCLLSFFVFVLILISYQLILKWSNLFLFFFVLLYHGLNIILSWHSLVRHTTPHHTSTFKETTTNTKGYTYIPIEWERARNKERKVWVCKYQNTQTTNRPHISQFFLRFTRETCSILCDCFVE